MRRPLSEVIRVYPPILVRLLAKTRYGPPLTTIEIADASGMTPARVDAISSSTTWAGIDVLEMLKFTAACGVSFEDPKQMKRASVYRRGKVRGGMRMPPSFQYLRRSADWERVYVPLIKRLYGPTGNP